LYDPEKNECIKILLNKSLLQKSYGIQNELKVIMNSEEMRQNFESWKKLKVAVLTWNLAGKGAPQNFDASRVLLPDTI
jgi:hypothetical protein